MSEPLGLDLQPGVCREQLGQIAMRVGELHDQSAPARRSKVDREARAETL